MYKTSVDLGFGVISKNSLPALKCRIFPALSSKACIASCFTLRSTASFGLTLNTKYEKSFFYGPKYGRTIQTDNWSNTIC